MKNSILSLVIAGSAIMGGIIGGGINEHQRNTEQTEAWRNVLVVQGGTLVANPSALTPEELADAEILKKRPRLIGFNCNGKTMVGESFEDFPIMDCRSVQSVDGAIKEANEREAL